MIHHRTRTGRRTLARRRPNLVEPLEARRLLAVHTLTLGTGDGALSVRVDGFGSYGALSVGGAEDATDAAFDPHGAAAGGTTDFSALFFEPADGYLTEDANFAAGGLTPAAISGSATSASSVFTVAGFQVTLTQTLESVTDSDLAGARLVQRYQIRNVSGQETSFKIGRAVEANMQWGGAANSDYAGLFSDRNSIAFFDENAADRYFWFTQSVDEDASTGSASGERFTVQQAPYLTQIPNADGIPTGDADEFANDTAAPVRVSDTAGQYVGALQTTVDLDTNDLVIYTTTTTFISFDPNVTGNPVTPEDVVVDYGALSVTDVTVNESAGTATLTVTRSADSGTVTVDYALGGGTATSGADYAATAGTLTFAAFETSKTITVAITDDTAFEGPETATLTLTNPTLATIATGTATLTIVDDDIAGAVTLDAATYAVDEAAGTLTVTLTRDGGAGPVTVLLTAPGLSATNGADYTLADQTVTFAGGEFAKTITIPIADDALVEGNESFQIVLSSPTGGLTLGATPTAVVTIADNDVSVQLAAPTYQVAEQTGAVTLTVTRAGPTTGVVTVAYATADGTATGGVDYTPASGTVTFNPGETTKTIVVSVANDGVDEPGETFTVTLSNPTGAGVQLGAPAAATVTILPPDVTGPVVGGVTPNVERNRVTRLTLALDEPLQPTTAINAPGNYQLTRYGSNKVIPLQAAVYDSTVGGILLFPRKGLRQNALYQVVVDPTNIRDTSGNVLTGNRQDGKLAVLFGQGRRITVVDADGDEGQLRLTGGGTVRVTRDAGDANPVVELLDTTAGNSVLTGTRRKGAGPIDIAELVGTTGVSNQLPAGVFNVTTISP